MAAAPQFIRPDKCLGDCGRKLHASTISARAAAPEGSVQHHSGGRCKRCFKRLAQERERERAALLQPVLQERKRETVEQSRAWVDSYIADRRARGIPPKGLRTKS